MRLKFTFNKYYCLIALVLFIVEILIALYVHDAFVRPYIGDFLAVVLLYSFAKSCINSPILPTAIAVLLFAYLIEYLQYMQLVTLLGLQHNAFARTVIGTSFEWIDMLAYTLGIGLVLVAEHLRNYNKQATR